MRHYFVLVLVLAAVILTGCDNSVKHAKANSIRQQTQRTNDKHNLAMADSRALTPTRLMVKNVMLWSLMASVAAAILSAGAAASYLFVGSSVNYIRYQRMQKIPLDVATRQYPLLVYGNGRRIFNPNTGERLLLSETSDAQLPRIEASTKVQLAGLIPDRILDGEVIK